MRLSTPVACASLFMSPEVVISDDGPGVPEAERGRVFQPFYRLEASRNVGTGGSGLGQPLCNSVERSPRLEIDIGDSVLGGAEFRWRFDKDAVESELRSFSAAHGG